MSEYLVVFANGDWHTTRQAPPPNESERYRVMELPRAFDDNDVEDFAHMLYHGAPQDEIDYEIVARGLN